MATTVRRAEHHDLRLTTVTNGRNSISSWRSATPVFVIAIALVALVLRGPIVAVAPVVDAIRADLALTATQAGLLTSIPVLCFALATPLAVAVIARAGADAAVSISVLGVALGTIIRSSGELTATVIGTIVIGAFITIGNVVVPVVIRRDVAPARVGLTTGVYTAALNIGSTITALGTAPLAESWGWRGALLAWSSFSVLALAAWLIAVGRRRAFVPIRAGAIAAADAAGSPPRVWRSLTVLLLAISFASQGFSYYGVTAWLPTLLMDENGFTIAQAGASSSVFQIAAVVGALGVPLLVSRLQPFGSFIVVGALWACVPLGLLFAPELWLLWCLLGGAAQGGGITIIFVVIVRIARSDAHASRLSATVQGIAYALSATAPTVVGFAHDLTAAWTAPLLVVLVAVLSFTVLGCIASVRQARVGH
ncbi:MFS transporter [Microbacteriaceae bacterium VKM Ac-2854]|nr:MFS transporter [Microbacteriaceae bacterium VKM Ac-2854]